MEKLWQDLRFGFRLLIKSPVFACVAVLSLAFGIGANTAIFSLVNAVILRPLPIEKPEEVVSVYTVSGSGMPYGSTSFPDYLDYRNQGKTFTGLVASKFTLASIGSGDQNEVVPAILASGNYFSLLGVSMMLGRAFTPEEDQKPGGSPVLVISHAYWERRFGSDPGVVGRSIQLNGNPFTIIGVVTKDFNGTFLGINPDLWVPVTMQPQVMPARNNPMEDRHDRWLDLMGRLKPGVSAEQAQSDLNVIAAQLDSAYPDINEGRVRQINIIPSGSVPPGFRGPVLAFTGVLMVIVGLGLLIACANVANLLLARATTRKKEVSIRLTMGASRKRLIRQMLTESMLLSLLGGAAGLLIALLTGNLINLFKPPTPIPISINLALDMRVLTFAFILSILTGIVFGLAPAIYSSKSDLTAWLKGETPSLGKGRRKLALGKLLVVAQISLSLILLIVAALFLRNLQSLRSVDPGFRTENVALVWLDLNLRGYNVNRGREFYRQLSERVRLMPGVENLSLSSNVPLGLAFSEAFITIEGQQPPPDGVFIQAGAPIVEPSYFDTMGVAVLRGRNLGDKDFLASQKVILVNETMAQRFWPNEEAIGKRIQLTPRPSPESDYYEIVGVVKDSKYVSFSEDPRAVFYRPFSQVYSAEMNLLVQTASDPGAILPALRREVQALDPEAPILAIKTLKENMGTSLVPWQLAATLAGAAGTVAILLAVIGIYGVVSYSVGQRLKEIGIRMALGARATDILRMVLAQGFKYALIGVIIGVVIAALLAQALSGVLYGVNAFDPVTFVAIPVLLTLIVLLASYVPARRATKVDPMVVLRYE